MERRKFLRALVGTSGGAALVRAIGSLYPEARNRLTTAVVEAQGGYELYGGFVLIQDGLPPPPYVIDGYGPPNGCNPLETPGPSPTETTYASVQAAADAVGHSAYELQTPLPSGLTLALVEAVTFDTGAPYCIRVRYEQTDPVSGEPATAVTVISRMDYPQPFPMWHPDPLEDEGQPLQQVTFLPTAGLLSEDPGGGRYGLWWIESGLLLSVIAQDPPYAAPSALAAALVRRDPA
jgi:hypothetical protein